MPVKKHIVKFGKDNTIAIPKSLCDSMGIGENTVVRMYSNKTGYQIMPEVPMSYENMSLLEQYKMENAQLRVRINDLENKYGNI